METYGIWLNKLIQAYEPSLDAKDRTFPRFLLNIPHVSQDILTLLRILCQEADRYDLLKVQRRPKLTRMMHEGCK